MGRSFPAVSVVVPIYKVERYLVQCVDSILAQSLTDIEVLLVDDGSPDGCPALVDAYAAKDERVVAIHQENQGAGAARNTGLSRARGEYVIFLDSDDLYEATMLECMVARARTYAADMVICRADVMGEEETFLPMDHQLRQECLNHCSMDSFCPHRDIPEHLFQFVVGWPWDKLYRRDFVLQTGLLFQNLPHTNDAYFVYMSLVKAEVVSVEPTVLVHHRMHASSISHNTAKCTSSLIDALLAIYPEIKQTENVMLEQSFYHWSMNIAVWHYRQLIDAPAAEFQQRLRNDLEPVLQLLAKGETYYPRKRDWKRYKKCVAPENFLLSFWKKLVGRL